MSDTDTGPATISAPVEDTPAATAVNPTSNTVGPTTLKPVPPGPRNTFDLPVPRAAPHVVKLRHPEPVPLQGLLRRLEAIEKGERDTLAIVEDNAWMLLQLSSWNEIVCIDPNINWAQEGAREVILRHQDREWSMLVRSFYAQHRLVDQRYRDRIRGGALLLEQMYLDSIKAVEEDEVHALKDILRWEKIHRPWLMPSPGSRTPPSRKAPGGGGEVAKRPNSSVRGPTKPDGTISFAFRGRQMWAQEKQLKYEWKKYQQRFAYMEEQEELARGEVEADEALLFMRMHRSYLEERFVAHRQYLARMKDKDNKSPIRTSYQTPSSETTAKEGPTTAPQVSEATISRQRTDAAKKIQRCGRAYVARGIRREKAEAVRVFVEGKDDDEESARKIQHAARGYIARQRVGDRKEALATSTEQRISDEPATEEEMEASAPFGSEPSQTEDRVVIQESENLSSSQQQRASPTRRVSFHPEVEDEEERRPPPRRSYSISSSSSAIPALKPWTAGSAQKGFLGLEILAVTVVDTDRYAELPNLHPFWRSLGYQFEKEPEPSPLSDSDIPLNGSIEDDDKESPPPSTQELPSSYAMLDLLCSTVEEKDIEAKTSLFMVVEGLYARRPPTVAAEPPTAPSEDTGTGSAPQHEEKADTLSPVELGTYANMERLLVEGRLAYPELDPTPWVPTRAVDLGTLELHWNTDNHHKGVHNAVELSPLRWSEYRDTKELELEELKEMDDQEMLQREYIVEEQIQDAYGILCVFYLSTGAKEPRADDANDKKMTEKEVEEMEEY